MMRDLGLLILRLTVGGLLSGHGSQKSFGWFGGFGLQGTAGWLESLGMKPGTPWAIGARRRTDCPRFSVSAWPNQHNGSHEHGNS